MPLPTTLLSDPACPTALAAAEWWHALPAVNASLNGLSAIFLLTAFIMIKQRRIAAHATLMICAFVTSTVFLACYLVYHGIKLLRGETLTRFPAGPWRMPYLVLLISHTFLAVVILPLIFASLRLAHQQKWRLHRRTSSFTFPLWFYVSVTGVVVYWMLYHVAPTLAHPSA